MKIRRKCNQIGLKIDSFSIIFILFIFCGFICLANNSTKTNNDQNVKYYQNIADSIYEISSLHQLHGRWKEAINLLNKGIEIMQLGKYQKGQAKLQGLLGGIIWKMGKHQKAMDMLSEAHQIAEQLGDKKNLANILYNRGEVYYVSEFYLEKDVKGKGLEFHQKALKLREKIGDQKAITHSLSRIGVIYERMGNMKTAMDYYQRAIRLGEKINYKRGTERALTHIGAYHYQRGDFKKGLEYFQKSLAIDEASRDQQSLLFSLVNVAQAIYKIEGDFNRAMKNCHRALKIAENIDFKLGIARTLFVMGALCQEEDQNDQALRYFNKTIDTIKDFGYKGFMEAAQKKIQEIKKDNP